MNDTALPRAPARLVPVDQLSAISSVVAEGAVFEGTFSARDDLGLKIDGVLKGDIRLQNGGTVHIGAAGVVEANTIEADHVLLEGQVCGTVIARKTLEITGTATLLGDALYDLLLDVHPRARLRGKVEYRGEINPIDTAAASADDGTGVTSVAPSGGY